MTEEAEGMEATGKARYDGFADWYEAVFAPHAQATGAELVRLLGAGLGPCLDMVCGTGLHF